MRIYCLTTIRQVTRYWLIGTVLFFALLMFYTSSPVFGAQAATPTPDVKTVPPLQLVATPTNTAVPTVTPVPVAPVNTLAPTATSAATNAGPTSTAPSPTATRRSSATPDDDDDDNEADTPSGGGSSPALPAPPSISQPAGITSTQIVSGRVFTGTVASVVLNLRKNPNGEQRPIDTLFRGDMVQILGRSADGAWWLICCGADARLPGWVSATSIRPSFVISQTNPLLPIMAGQSGALGASTTVSGTRQTSTDTRALQVEMRPNPAFAWQGQTVAIQVVITNRGTVAATNIRLRDHLPPTLQYMRAVVGNQGQLQTQASAEGGSVINLAWARLAPGASVTATITVQIAPNAAADSLIDNLALVTADQQADVSVGVTLAMPPTVLPQFSGQ